MDEQGVVVGYSKDEQTILAQLNGYRITLAQVVRTTPDHILRLAREKLVPWENIRAHLAQTSPPNLETRLSDVNQLTAQMLTEKRK